jgi:hypothetical protein
LSRQSFFPADLRVRNEVTEKKLTSQFYSYDFIRKLNKINISVFLGFTLYYPLIK